MSLGLGLASIKRARWGTIVLALAITGTVGKAGTAGASIIALPAFPVVAAGKTPPRANNVVVESSGRIWVFASTSTRVVVLSQRGLVSTMTIAGVGLVSHAVAMQHGGVCYSEVDIGETEATGHQLRFIGCVDARFRRHAIDVPHDFAGVDSLATGPHVDLALVDTSRQRLARIVAGRALQYQLAGKRTISEGLVVAADGAVWFTDDTPAGPRSNIIERIALNGAVQKLNLPGYSASQILASGPDGVILLSGAAVGSMLVKARMVFGSPSIVWRKHVPDAGFIATTSDGSTWLVDQELGLILYRLDARGDITRVRRPDGAGSPITALTAHGSDVWYATLANNLVHLSATGRTRR